MKKVVLFIPRVKFPTPGTWLALIGTIGVRGKFIQWLRPTRTAKAGSATPRDVKFVY